MLLSVIVPYYNNGDTMKRCIRSLTSCLKAESYEVIIVDDGSDSREKSLLRTFLTQKSWHQVKLVEQEHMGAAAARNRGIKEASGLYLAFVDADDYVANSAIDTFLNLLSEVQESEDGNMNDATAPDLFKLGPMTKNSQALSAAEYGLREFADSQANMDASMENARRMGDTDATIRRMRDSMDVKFRTTTTPLALMRPLTSCLDHTTYLYRRNFVTQHRLSYPEGMKLMEDSFFILRCLEEARTIANYDELVFYCFDESHSTASPLRNKARKRWDKAQSRQNVDDCLKFFAELHTLAQQNTIVQPLYDRYLYVYMRVLAVKCCPWSEIRRFRKDAAASADSLYFNTPLRRRPRLMGHAFIHRGLSVVCHLARSFCKEASSMQKRTQALTH